MGDERAAKTIAKTGWVLVPVPEEHVASVYGRILQLSMGAAGAAWDLETLVDHLETLAPEGRELLRIVARGVVDESPVVVRDVATELGLSSRELFGLVHEVNIVDSEAAHPTLVMIRGVGVQANLAARPMTMFDPVAQMVLAALDRTSSPHTSH